MRTVVAVILAAAILLTGFWAISTQASSVQPTLNSSEANTTYDVATDVFEGVGGTLAVALPWAGFAAVVLVSLGVLVGAFAGGR